MGGIPGTATTVWRVNLGPHTGGDLQVVVLFNRLYTHDEALMPLLGDELRAVPGSAGLGSNYAFQVLMTQLLAAYAAAEGNAAARVWAVGL